MNWFFFFLRKKKIYGDFFTFWFGLKVELFSLESCNLKKKICSWTWSESKVSSICMFKKQQRSIPCLVSIVFTSPLDGHINHWTLCHISFCCIYSQSFEVLYGAQRREQKAEAILKTTVAKGSMKRKMSEENLWILEILVETNHGKVHKSHFWKCPDCPKMSSLTKRFCHLSKMSSLQKCLYFPNYFKLTHVLMTTFTLN